MIDSYDVLCAAIRRDSIPLFKFPFRSHTHVFSREILSVYHLKCTYIYFSSHFCFLVIVNMFVLILSQQLLAVVISLSLFFFM